MKNLILLVLICLLLNSLVYSQTDELSESQKLNQQVASLYQQGKIEEAIRIAEKIVEIQRKKSDKDWVSLATAIKNLAMLQNAQYEILDKEMSDPNLTEEELSKIRFHKIKYIDSIPVLFEEVIKLYKEKIKIEDLRLAEAQFELASFLNGPQGKYPYLGSIETEKVEELYIQSLSIREKILGESDDLTLSTVLKIANFYQNDAEFEKSLPLYQRCIKEIEKKYGKNSHYLLFPLQIYARVLMAIQLEKEANVIIDQISMISGKPEPLSDFNLDLTLRNKVNKSEELIEDRNTITSYLKKEKFLLVNVLIDENGKVIELKAAETEDKNIHGKDVQKKAEKDVKDWRFKPLIYNGTARKMKGIVWYPYFIKA